MMKRLSTFILVFAFLGVALAGCSRLDDPAMPVYQTGHDLSAARAPLALSVTALPAVTTSAVISGYLVHFDGREYDKGQTTFSYTVSGAGAAHTLSNFFLELPDCAPALDSFVPAGAVIGVNPLSGIYGVKWDKSLGTNESRSYSITFPGDIPLGVIRTSVKASTLLEIAEIAGPCGGFEISGTVFIDADSNGVMTEADELGIIVDVTVTLADSDGNVLQTALTDINGEYAFLKTAGTYTVRIDAETAADDFNEELAASFDPTGPTSRIVTVGPDAIGIDFGFDPRTEEITYDIEMGVLLTTGEDVKFWKKQVRTAMNGKGKAEFDAATMAQFITEIQGLFFPEPFQFTPGNEFQEALDILSIQSKDPYQQLLRELLTAEFNEVSGKGLVDAPDLQSVMLSWAESVAIAAAPVESAASLASPLPSGGSDRPLLGMPIGDRVGDAVDFLSQLNGSTAGGSGGGG